MGIELGEQADAWSRLWLRRGAVRALVAGLPVARLRRVVFAGCGDCHAAAEYGELLLGLRANHEARGLAAMELSRGRPHLLGPETLLVALSVSGRTPRVLEAVAAARRRAAAVLAVTDDPGSPLAREVAATLVLGAAPAETLGRTDYRDPAAARYVGYQRSVPQTKTFGALQLALALLCLELEPSAPSGRGTPAADLERCLQALPQLAGAAADAGRRAAERMARAGARPRVAVCGTGFGGPAARFGAYTLHELAWPAGHGEIEEFCHTLYLVTRP
ncbi:MAG: SIS domain-containing protein, partial [Deferrisomatales bacterium]